MLIGTPLKQSKEVKVLTRTVVRIVALFIAVAATPAAASAEPLISRSAGTSVASAKLAVSIPPPVTTVVGKITQMFDSKKCRSFSNRIWFERMTKTGWMRFEPEHATYRSRGKSQTVKAWIIDFNQATVGTKFRLKAVSRFMCGRQKPSIPLSIPLDSLSHFSTPSGTGTHTGGGFSTPS